MAWPRVPCLLLILLLLLHTCLPQPGPPSPPSAPQCHIPYTEGRQADIHCFWDPGQNPQIPTSYSLHWNSTEGISSVVEGTNVSGVIPRELYTSYSDLTVLVKAANQHGSATSTMAAFNTGDIKKPPTPEITHHCPQPLEIYWIVQCEDQGSSDQHCEVQYRPQDQQGWTQAATHLTSELDNLKAQKSRLQEIQMSFTLSNIVPPEFFDHEEEEETTTEPHGHREAPEASSEASKTPEEHHIEGCNGDKMTEETTGPFSSSSAAAEGHEAQEQRDRELETVD